MEVFLVYLWMQLDEWLASLRFFAFFGALACAVGAVIRFAEILRRDHYDCINETTERRHNTFCRWHTAVCVSTIISLVLVATLPSSKTVAVMVGTHYAVQLAGSPEGEKVMSLIRKRANEYLDEQLKENNPVNGR